MQIISSGSRFTFDYPVASQNNSLFIAGKVYDVSTGSAVFITLIPMASILVGVYAGSFPSTATKSYLVISNVYTDGTYTSLSPGWAPQAEVYRASDAPAGFVPFNYGVFDQESALFIAANIYNNSTGIPSLVSQVPMLHIFSGVYFGAYMGIQANTFEVIKYVYTDGTYSTISPNFSPGTEQIQTFGVTVNQIVFQQAIMVAEPFSATLEGLPP